MTVVTEKVIPASIDVPTEKTIPENWTNNSLSYAYTMLKVMSLYRILLKHPEWFESGANITYEVLVGEDEIRANEKLVHELKRVKDESNSDVPDQDFQTKINIFRGNFFTRFVGQWTILLKHFDAVAGYEQDVKSWFGDDYQEICDYVTQFARRIAVRKNASGQEAELVSRLKNGRPDNVHEKVMANTEALAYLAQIEQDHKDKWVAIEEVVKAFLINDLLIMFYESWRGKRFVYDNTKQQLIREVLEPLKTPMPGSTSKK